MNDAVSSAKSADTPKRTRKTTKAAAAQNEANGTQSPTKAPEGGKADAASDTPGDANPVPKSHRSRDHKKPKPDAREAHDDADSSAGASRPRSR